MAANLLMTATVLAQVTRDGRSIALLALRAGSDASKGNSTRGPSPDVRTLAGGRGIA